jgi:tetratricopeptide (TPR) repeat protein
MFKRRYVIITIPIITMIVIFMAYRFLIGLSDFINFDLGPSPASEMYSAGGYAASVKFQEEAVKRAYSDARAARELSDLSWYKLFVRDFEGALSAADQAIALEPDDILRHIDKALALTCLGRVEEANVLYTQYRGRNFANSEVQWEEGALRSIIEMEKRGLTCPQMNSFRDTLSQSAGSFLTPRAAGTAMSPPTASPRR